MSLLALLNTMQPRNKDTKVMWKPVLNFETVLILKFLFYFFKLTMENQ